MGVVKLKYIYNWGKKGTQVWLTKNITNKKMKVQIPFLIFTSSPAFTLALGTESQGTVVEIYFCGLGHALKNKLHQK